MWTCLMSASSLLHKSCVYFSSCPAGGDIAAVSDAAAEGQGVPAPTEHGAECPLCTWGRPSGEAAGSYSGETHLKHTARIIIKSPHCVFLVQVQLEDTKRARENVYEKYVVSRLGPAALTHHQTWSFWRQQYDPVDRTCTQKWGKHFLPKFTFFLLQRSL